MNSLLIASVRLFSHTLQTVTSDVIQWTEGETFHTETDSLISWEISADWFTELPALHTSTVQSVYLNVISVLLLWVFSLLLLIKSPDWQQSHVAPETDCSQHKDPFSTKIPTALFALPHLNKHPSCLFLSSTCAPCALRWAPKHHTDGKREFQLPNCHSAASVGCK